MSESHHHHRRAHSNDTFCLSEFAHMVNFDDPYDVNIFNFPSPLSNTPNDDVVAMAVTALGVPNDHHSMPNRPPGSPTGHLRSFSSDDIGLGMIDSVNGEDRENERNESKNALTPNELAELTIVDPTTARRIGSNRKSAVLSNERKNHSANELEINVKTLQTKAANIAAQVTMLQRDITGLTVENKELKLRIEAMHQQARLRDGINELLKQELQRLKIQKSQNFAFSGNSSFSGLVSQFASQLALHHLTNNPSQQSQPEQIMPPSYFNHPFNAQPSRDFSYFNQQN